MIVFDLKCGHDHLFEAWFRSSADYEDQRARRLIACPFCADAAVEKAVMAPNIPAKANQRAEQPVKRDGARDTPPPTPQQVKQVLAQLAQAQARMLEKSEWVGGAFVDRARAMHLGDEPARQIHGQASVEQARELADEGIAVAPLLLPVVPPEARN